MRARRPATRRWSRSRAWRAARRRDDGNGRRRRSSRRPTGAGYFMRRAAADARREGQTYQLWALMPDGMKPTMVSVGVLGSEPDGAARSPPTRRSWATAVTEEDCTRRHGHRPADDVRRACSPSDDVHDDAADPSQTVTPSRRGRARQIEEARPRRSDDRTDRVRRRAARASRRSCTVVADGCAWRDVEPGGPAGRQSDPTCTTAAHRAPRTGRSRAGAASPSRPPRPRCRDANPTIEVPAVAGEAVERAVADLAADAVEHDVDADAVGRVVDGRRRSRRPR